MADERIKEPKREPRRFVVVSGEENPPDSLVGEALRSPDALEGLCDYYVPRIYNYVLKRVGRVHDAEDVTSIVFEKVLMNLGTFDRSKASFSTWIYRVATNCVTDFYRSRGRRKEAPLEEERLGGRRTAGTDMERLDLQVTLLELLGELPEKYREAIGLRYFAGMRVQEVAETLGITESAASKRILRGLDELKKLADAGPLADLL